HEVGPRGPAGGKGAVAVGLQVRSGLAGDDLDRQPRPPRSLDAERVRPAGDDLNDARSQPAVGDSVDQVLKRGPAAAEEDREVEWADVGHGSALEATWENTPAGWYIHGQIGGLDMSPKTREYAGAAIWERVFRSTEPTVAAEAARAILALDFSPEDKARAKE